jgi:hypothetical protein
MPPKVITEGILAKLDVITIQLVGLESVPNSPGVPERELQLASETNKELVATLEEK